MASKICIKCGELKPIDLFYAQAGMRDGHRNDCKSCMRSRHRAWYQGNREKSIASVQRWREDNPEKYQAWLKRNREENKEKRREQSRRTHLKRAYGLTQNMFEALVLAQLGKCAICGSLEAPNLHVDHDHRTNKVRGLLCGKCNKAIGLLDDDPDRLMTARGYLKRADRFWGASA